MGFICLETSKMEDFTLSQFIDQSRTATAFGAAEFEFLLGVTFVLFLSAK
jgi:hypothetical protein